MKSCMLNSPLAEKLYNESAGMLPIIDYHNHLSAGDLRGDRQYADLTEIWIAPDPYKHRLMRICGVNEQSITGNADNYTKFSEWCRIFPDISGTSVYNWSLMELEFLFGRKIVPCSGNHKAIWDEAKKILKQKNCSANAILKRFGVEYAAPCTSVLENVEFYKENTVLSPSLRGDDIVDPSLEFIRMLEKMTSVSIHSAEDFFSAVFKRFDEFEKAGCIFSDHAIDDSFAYCADEGNFNYVFKKLLSGNYISYKEQLQLQSHILLKLSIEYAKRDWVMQLHIGALRNTSSRLRRLAGASGGFAGIGTNIDISQIARFLDDIEGSVGSLPKTVIFTLNPSYNAAVSILSGSYSKDGVKSVVSQGPAWWWCDHADGIREMLDKTAVYSVLSGFIGMTTDSRSMLSFVRHDYFRRALCSWVAEKIENQEFPRDAQTVNGIIKKCVYGNAKEILLRKKESDYQLL